jgi:diguanylate cyclase (GGDEF)-like protein
MKLGAADYLPKLFPLALLRLVVGRLPETTTRMAGEVAERVRLAVEAAHLEGLPSGAGGHFTVSLGIATCPEDATEQSELIRQADLALYQAKTGGRHRVWRAGEGSPGEIST